MALRYSLDLDKEADQLDAAVQQVLDDGLRTKDILSKGKKEVTTTEMGDAIISKLKYNIRYEPGNNWRHG